MRSRFRRRPSAVRGEDADLVDLLFGEQEGSAVNPAAERKLKQLCREVYRVLSQVLPAEVNDRVLDSVVVVEVCPAPDASRLAVRVALGEGADPSTVLQHLERLKGYLRSEIAAAIQRKRTPELAFEVTA
jgi:ribosome-binding factor A